MHETRCSDCARGVDGLVEEQERPWDEGLTPQERADAKRRYKNRKGVERWRRRKQVRLPLMSLLLQDPDVDADILAIGSGVPG